MSNNTPSITPWPIRAKMLSKQLEVINKLDKFFDAPNFFSSISIINGTTTAGLTAHIKNLFLVPLKLIF